MDTWSFTKRQQNPEQMHDTQKCRFSHDKTPTTTVTYKYSQQLEDGWMRGWTDRQIPVRRSTGTLPCTSRGWGTAGAGGRVSQYNLSGKHFGKKSVK